MARPINYFTVKNVEKNFCIDATVRD
jgi:hypothetical protein